MPNNNWTGNTGSTVNDVIHIPGRGEVVAATNGGGIVVFDESDGSKLRTVATVTKPDDLIYDSSNGQLYVAEFNGVHAYDISTGTEKWAQLSWPNEPIGLALDGSGQLYIAGNTGFVAEVNPSDGSKVWQNKNADGSTFPAIAYLDANDRLYVGNNNGNLLEIDPADGTQIAKISTAGNSNVEAVRTAGGDIFTGGAGGWQRWDASLSNLQTVSSPTDVQELRADAKSNSVFIADGPGERWEVYDYNGTLVDSLDTPSTDHATAIALGDDNPRTFYGGYYVGVISATTGRVAGSGVSGIVAGSDGSGISPATVDLRQSGSVVKSTTTASDGSYSFSGVLDGDYTVAVGGGAIFNESKTVTVSGSDVTTDFTVSPADLSGSITDSGGNPITSATVELIDANGNVVNSVGPDGSGDYLFDGGLSANTGFTVRVSKPEFFTEEQRVNVGSNPVTGVDFTLGKRVNVDVTAETVEGRAAAAVPASITDSGRSASADTTGRDGTVSIAGGGSVGKTTLRLGVGDRRFVTKDVTVDLSAGDRSVTVQLPRRTNAGTR